MAEGSEKTEQTKDETLNEDDLKAVSNIKDRLEFFFSDANVRQDRFIRKFLLDKDGEAKGRVPIESLLRFNTIKRHTEKAAVIVKAAKELSDLLTLDEKESAIGRAVEFTQAMMNDNVPKTLFVKNLPVKESDENNGKIYDVTVDEIKELFKKYGDVCLVKTMWSGNRKKNEKIADGCAMVEFSTKEGLEKAVAATLTIKEGAEVDATDKLEIKESKISVMLFSEWIENKRKKRGERGGNKRDREEDAEEEKEIKTFTFDWKPGCVIKMKGLPKGCNREAILDAVALQLDISVTEVKNKKIYADYSMGQTDGAIRFLEPADHVAEMAKRLKNGELQIGGEKVEDAFVLEGDTEKKYYDDFIEFKNKQIRHHEENRRSRKKGKHWHHGRNRK
jgi:RNA recognition motif-containing protein